MKPFLTGACFCFIFFTACKPSKKDEPKNFISILSLIKKQVAHIDTSLYSIKKITSTDSIHYDTVFINRETFHNVAKEFLEIPDLSNRKVAKKYKEEPARYDDMLGRVIISYTALNPEKEEYTSQELLVTPDIAAGDKVNTIIIKRIFKEGETNVFQTLLWQMDKSFQITTSQQRNGEPEQTNISKVTWNEESPE